MKNFPLIPLLICIASFCLVMGIMETAEWIAYWDYANNCCNCNNYPYEWIFNLWVGGVVVCLSSGIYFGYDVIRNRKKIFGNPEQR